MIAVRVVLTDLLQNIVEHRGKKFFASSVMTDATFKRTWRWEEAKMQGSEKGEK